MPVEPVVKNLKISNTATKSRLKRQVKLFATVANSVDDFQGMKKSLGTKLPKKVQRLMGNGWQPPLDEVEIENGLLQDPFLQPKFQSKPRVVFTRAKVTNAKEFELKVRPEKQATGVPLTEQDLGSTLQFKVKRECRAMTPNNKFRRKGSPTQQSFERAIDDPFLNDYSGSDQEDMFHIL